MKIGITLNVFYEIIEGLHVRGEPIDTNADDLSPEKQLQLIERLNIRFIEVQGPLHHVKSEHVSLLKKRLSPSGIKASSLHAPFPVFYEKRIDDISCPDEETRKKSVNLLKKAIETCAPLEVKILVLHPTGARTDNGLGLDKNIPLKKARMERCKESLRELSEFCSNYKIDIALENELSGDLEDSGDLLSIINDIDCDNVGLCLDTGHIFISGEDPSKAAELYGKKLFHIHVHDNDGKEDQHLVPFCGKINWEKFVKTLHRIDYPGIFQMEISAGKAVSERNEFLQVKSLISK